MAERVLVLSADWWQMTDEKTGVMSEGWSMWYVNEYREDSEKSFGSKPTKMTLRDDAMAQLLRNVTPCIAEFEMGSRPGAQNKAAVFCRALKVVTPNVDYLRLPQQRAA